MTDKSYYQNFFELKLSDEEIKELEKLVQDEPAPKVCVNYYVIPDEENQTIDIMSDTNDVVLHLDKQTAIVLATIIQDCVNGWI